MKNILISLSTKQLAALESMCKQEGKSRVALIRKAIDLLILNQSRPDSSNLLGLITELIKQGNFSLVTAMKSELSLVLDTLVLEIQKLREQLEDGRSSISMSESDVLF